MKMGRMTVYSPTGEAYTGEPVDCRELMAKGWKEKSADEQEPTEVVGTDFTKMTVAQLKEELGARNIEIPSGASKSQLLELLVTQ